MERTSVGGAVNRDPEGCWRGLAVLASAKLLAMTTWFSATAVVPQLEQHWQLGPGQSAWLTIAVQLGFVLGALGSALMSLSDRMSPRRLMLLGAAGAAAVNALLLVAEGFWPAIALRVVTGACLAAVYPPAMKAMATWFRFKRGTALGIMVGALTLGSAAPHLVNGLGGLDWRVVIIATSVLTLTGGLLAEFIGRDGPFPFPRAPFDPGKAWQAFTDRKVLLASLGYFGHMWELYAMWAWFSVFFTHVLATHDIADPGRWAAYATFAVIGIGAVGCLVGGLLGDRWGRAKATSLAMGLSGGCALIIGFLSGAPIALVLAVGLIWGFWVVADSAQFSTLVTEVADQSYVGTALTLQLAIGFTLTVPTLWLIPIVANALGWGAAFALLAIGPALGIAAMLGTREADRARLEPS
ncbi:MFS transporter [Aidingimonas halophila]|uniref:Sugar phosphate permease n=1 Tax=Aidingimonas halophila TaxID=574349 RepID=A0A1H2SUK4_9GAMM|nr:MFS transporter [Aidingimonas halophila]GHC17099.1 MFS transporter [Aidingimonas halophila]SDW35353.1 Sugar phosphate permease [Aidingimonas halophila]